MSDSFRSLDRQLRLPAADAVAGPYTGTDRRRDTRYSVAYVSPVYATVTLAEFDSAGAYGLANLLSDLDPFDHADSCSDHDLECDLDCDCDCHGDCDCHCHSD